MRSLAVVPVLVAAGCVAYSPAPGDAVTNVQYDCGGFRFSAQYGPQYATLSLPDGRSIHLSQATAATGTRYTDGTNTLTAQGGVARLELADAVHTQCAPL